MKVKLIGLFLFITAGLYAQKNVVVKKGDIKVNGEKVATYEGKGGNAFRMGKFEITLVGASSPAITLQEDAIYFKNPLFDEVHWIYEIRFADGDIAYYRAAPVTKKFFGNVVTLNPRKTGDDILEELFNDETPVFISNGALNKENIAAFKASSKAYPKEKIMKEAKESEEAIATITTVNVNRDKSKPVMFTAEKNKDADMGNWYLLTQDDKVIGRVYKRTGNEVTYQVWKKTPAGFKLQGKEVEFAPIAITENLSNGTGTLSKKFDGVYVADKKTFQFNSADALNAERDLVNSLIAAGVL
jgi:hypothetical protein